MTYESTGQLVLLSIITRALVAKGVLEKEDLLAELSRVQLAIPGDVLAQLQELILNMPDR